MTKYPYALGFDEWFKDNYEEGQEDFNLADMRLLYNELKSEILRLRSEQHDSVVIRKAKGSK